MRKEARKPWNWMLFPFSSIKANPCGVIAASVGFGVYEIDSQSNWEELNDGMPELTNIHRLQVHDDQLHACTNRGLFEWVEGEWENDGLSLPCYQYRRIGGASYAATESGLWSKLRSGWKLAACPDQKVYDFINLPHYLIIGHQSGISLYDRFMDEWAHFNLPGGVTSLVVYRGHLIGASDKGELFIGDKKGSFDLIRFGHRFIFKVVSKGKDVYVCTDKGLYKLAYIADQITLLSIRLGCPVTDIDVYGDELYLATLFQGIQKIKI